MRVGTKARFIIAASLLFVAQAGCASVKPRAYEPFTRIADSAAPFAIRLDSNTPFSRHGVPWDDANTVGLNITWLAVPEALRRELPPYVLIINEYPDSEGLLCLVDDGGRVVASTGELGLIQQLGSLRVAPTRLPQLLAYANSGHATGAVIGESILLLLDDAKLRIALRAPRFTSVTRDGERHECALPIVFNAGRTDCRITIPIFTARTDTGGEIATLEHDVLEYQWDDSSGVFHHASSTALVLSDDSAWTWLPDYADRSSAKRRSPE